MGIRRKTGLRSAIAVLCVFAFMGARDVASAGGGDELTDLKAQVKALQDTVTALTSKITDLEKKQVSQAKQIDKVPALADKVDQLKQSPVGAITEGATVGGHLKFYMFDQSWGRSQTDKDQNNNPSAGINHAYIYVGKEISDFLRADAAFDFSVSASATPSLGNRITRATSATTLASIHTAYLTALLPEQVELRAGKFNAMFSEEYAKETWWHEQYHQNQGLAYLESWHDVSVELYRNFDFDNFSLPVWLSYNNGNVFGSAEVDNNDGKTILLHVAPEFMAGSLRFPLSYAYGTWDDKDSNAIVRWAAGVDWKYESLNLVAEYLDNDYESLTLTGTGETSNGYRKGFYVKGLYDFTDKWQGIVKFSRAQLYNTAQARMRVDTYNTTLVGLNYEVWPGSTVMLDYMYIRGHRSVTDDLLRANRVTLGWRTTF